WQLGVVRDFARSHIAAGQAAIFAGDFNVGGDAARMAAAQRIGAPLAGGSEAVRVALDRGAVPARNLAEARAIHDKGTDQLFYRSGRALALDPVRLEIPFAVTGTEQPLSDHPGLMVRYTIESAGERG